MWVHQCIDKLFVDNPIIAIGGMSLTNINNNKTTHYGALNTPKILCQNPNTCDEAIAQLFFI